MPKFGSKFFEYHFFIGGVRLYKNQVINKVTVHCTANILLINEHGYVHIVAFHEI